MTLSERNRSGSKKKTLVPETQKTTTAITELEKGIIIPDTHAPNHNRKSWRLVEKVVRDWKPEHVLIQGDFFDCESVSQHRPRPGQRRDLEKEIKEAQKLLNVFDERPLKTKVFTMGNHEFRADRMILDQAPTMHGTVFGKDRDLFGLKARGWNVIPYMEDYDLGPMSATHDLGKAGLGAVEDAMQTYIGRNSTIGHVHTFTYRIRGNAKGIPFFGVSFGWLGDLKYIDYRHRMKALRDYVQGFGVFRYNPKTKIIYVFPTPIVMGTCVVEGRLFHA